MFDRYPASTNSFMVGAGSEGRLSSSYKGKVIPILIEMPFDRRPMMDMTQDDKSEEARLYIVLGNIDWDLH